MAQIDPDSLTDPKARRLIKTYGYSLSNTPLKTHFHRNPPILDYGDEAKAIASKKEYDYSNVFIDDLWYRYIFDSNLKLEIYGPSSDFKSTLALAVKYQCEMLIAKQKNVALDDIVDSDATLLKRFTRPDTFRFETFIKDEWDTTMSGLGNMTMSETVTNVLKRSRLTGRNIIICTPPFKPYPVDYFLEVWEYQRFGDKRVMALLYDHEAHIRGNVVLPMPPDALIEAYLTGPKARFMKNMDGLKFNIDEAMVEIAEKLVADPHLPPIKKGASCRNGFLVYATRLYPELQSKVQKKDIWEKVLYLKEEGLTKFPMPESVEELPEPGHDGPKATDEDDKDA